MKKDQAKVLLLVVVVLAAVTSFVSAQQHFATQEHHTLDTRVHQSRKVFSRVDIVDPETDEAAAQNDGGGDSGDPRKPYYPPQDPVEQRDQSAAIASDAGRQPRRPSHQERQHVVEGEAGEETNYFQVEQDVTKDAERHNIEERRQHEEAGEENKRVDQSNVFVSKRRGGSKRKTHIQRYKAWQKGQYEAHKLGLKEQSERDKRFEQGELAPDLSRKAENEPYTRHMHRVQRGDKPLRKSASGDVEEKQTSGDLKFGYKDRADAEGMTEREAEQDVAEHEAWNKPTTATGGADDEKKTKTSKKVNKKGGMTKQDANRRKFNPESDDADNKKRRKGEDEDDDVDVEEFRKKIFVKGPSGVSREERRKIRNKAHLMDDDEFNELQNEIGDPTIEDPGKCQAVASKFCKGLMYSFAEFTACAIRDKAKFEAKDAHCLYDFVEIYEDCAPDMVKHCPAMDSFHTNKCLLSPKITPRVSEACKASEYWELLEMEKVNMERVEKKMHEDEEEAFSHDPEGLAALRRAREKAHKRMRNPDHDPSHYVRTARVTAEGIEDKRAATARHRHGGLENIEDDTLLRGIHKGLGKNAQVEIFEHESSTDYDFHGDDL